MSDRSRTAAPSGPIEPAVPPPSRLAAGLLALGVLRVVPAFFPAGYFWGFDAPRQVPAWVTALLFVLLAALLTPAAAGAMARLSAPGWLRRPPVPQALAAALAAAIALLLEDRAGFVGDALLRQGVLEESGDFYRIFPQALPLDALLHHQWPRALANALHLPLRTLSRGTGALEAALLAVLATSLPRVLGLRGAAAVACASTLLFGGYLTLYTGYGKPTTEVLLLALATALFAARYLRGGRGAWAMTACAAIALALHRGALPLLPASLVLLALGARRHPPKSAGERTALAIAAALPLLTIAALAPRLLDTALGFDVRVNFLSPSVSAQGGLLAAAFHPVRLLDLANVLLMYAPLAPLLLLAPRDFWARAEARGALVLAAFFLPTMVLVMDTLGPFRDHDVLGTCAAMLSFASACWVGLWVARAPRAAALAAAVALAVAAPTLQQMWVQRGVDRGLKRAEAFSSGAPRRIDQHRWSTLDYISLRQMQLDRYADAAATFATLAAEAPSPRTLKSWGTAAALAGRDSVAFEAFQALTRRDPGDAFGWFGSWMMALQLHDEERAAALAGHMRGWTYDGPELRSVVAYLDHYPRLLERLRPAMAGLGPGGPAGGPPGP